MNVSHIQAAKFAVCAQVQHWIENEDGAYLDDNDIQSYSLGNISVNYNQTQQNSVKRLCETSNSYLKAAGLLYKGVKLS